MKYKCTFNNIFLPNFKGLRTDSKTKLMAWLQIVSYYDIRYGTQ